MELLETRSKPVYVTGTVQSVKTLKIPVRFIMCFREYEQNKRKIPSTNPKTITLDKSLL